MVCHRKLTLSFQNFRQNLILFIASFIAICVLTLCNNFAIMKLIIALIFEETLWAFLLELLPIIAADVIIIAKIIAIKKTNFLLVSPGTRLV